MGCLPTSTWQPSELRSLSAGGPPCPVLFAEAEEEKTLWGTALRVFCGSCPCAPVGFYSVVGRSTVECELRSKRCVSSMFCRQFEPQSRRIQLAQRWQGILLVYPGHFSCMCTEGAGEHALIEWLSPLWTMSIRLSRIVPLSRAECEKCRGVGRK